MKTFVLLLAFLSFLGCAPVTPVVPPGPVIPAPVPTPPAPQPPPVPPPVPPPTPPTTDPYEPFSSVKVGDTEGQVRTALGPPMTTTPVPDAGVTILVWKTTVIRPTGGFVLWEVVLENGIVISSKPW